MVDVFIAPTMPNDYCAAIQRWLTAEGHADLAIRGAGEVFWLETGRIVGMVTSQISADKLEQQTLRLWAC
jgi:hypothetical protein